jgi:DNA-directed RNA polymerase specialized sigma24 family protein
MARSLTKRDTAGTLYTRPPAIERDVDKAMALDPSAVRQRALDIDQQSPDYLTSECLVHLIREAKSRRDESMMNMLVQVLLTRCEAILNGKIRDSDLPFASDLREEVLSEFALLLASDGTGENPDELDYFECRFNRAFRSFRIDVVRKEMARIKHLAPLPAVSDEDDPGSDDEIKAWISKAFQTPASENYFLLLDAINGLPADERKAVVLCHMMGYEAESEDPMKETAATICRVTGRTIRNRLARAADKLSEFRI